MRKGAGRCRKCGAARVRRHGRNICIKCVRRYRLYKRYGITPEDFDKRLKKQGGKCAICRRPPLRRLHVDHCHDTGKVRGLLCWACNSGVGKLRDCPATMIRAARYIRKHK